MADRQFTRAGRATHEKGAEVLREIGLLVLVFGLLDEHVRYVGETTRLADAASAALLCAGTETAVDWTWVVLTVGLGSALIGAGLLWEWLLNS